MKTRHLSDERLVELALGRATSFKDDQHVAGCTACQARHASVAVLLDEVAEAAAVDGDIAFSAERLARQRARVLERVAHVAPPARVLAFRAERPASRASVSGLALSRRVAFGFNSRWVAAAAIAGLVVGLLADHAMTRVPGFRVTSSHPSAGIDGNALAVMARTVVPVESEDEFLGQLEAAVGAGPLILHPLDALTPGAADAAQ